MKTKLLYILLAFVLIFFVGLAKPANAGLVDTLEGWKANIEFVGAMVDNPGENMAQLVSKFAYGSLENTFTTLCVECTDSAERIQSANIPEYMKLGLTGIVENQVMAMFESQPQVNVVAHLAEEWVPGYKESNSVYAGGYDDLNDSGISLLWSATRNIAYIGYVIIMIVIGFMIMFRNKIGGQALVTIGNSIPKVVVSLVVVTFSFAIIGVIMDFGGVLTKVLSDILYSGSGDGISIYDPGKLVFEFLTGGSGVGTTVRGLGIAGIVIAIIGAIAGTGGAAIPVVVVGGLIILVLGIILLGIVIWGAIKLWLVLVKAYLSILINVITAPIMIMFGSLPGNEASMINVFKSVLRNVLVFPLAYGIVNLPFYVEAQTITLAFPESITGAGNTGGVLIGGFLLAIAKIVAIYAASSAPAILLGIIPATASKSGADAVGAIKASLGGVPFIGGMFK